MTNTIAPAEVEFSAVRAQGPGGQNVNKVSSAVHLRFDVEKSSLPEMWKRALLATPDHRITKEGVIVIKAQVHRSQDLNRADALARLRAFIEQRTTPQRRRVATRPTLGSQRRRLEGKVQRGEVKKLRGKVDESGVSPTSLRARCQEPVRLHSVRSRARRLPRTPTSVTPDPWRCR